MIVCCTHCNTACNIRDFVPTQQYLCPSCRHVLPAHSAQVDAKTANESPVRPQTALRGGQQPSGSPSAKPQPVASPEKKSTRSAPTASPSAKKPTKAEQEAHRPQVPSTPARKSKAEIALEPTPTREKATGSLPELDSMIAPVVPGFGRWITLLSILMAGFVLVCSVALGGWNMMRRSADKARLASLTLGFKEGPAENSRSNPGENPKKNPGENPKNNSGETLYGGIEIGSKGIKAVVIRAVERPGQGVSFDLVGSPQDANTTAVAGLKENGVISPSALADTARVVGNFHERFRSEHNLPPERIKIIVGNGLFAPIRDKTSLVATNKQHLNNAIHKATGQDIVFLDAIREGELNFRATIPSGHVDDALLIDVGSGSTKFNYGEANGARFVALAIPFGTESLTDEVQKRVTTRGGTFTEQLSQLLTNHIKLEQFREDIKSHPALSNQRHVYLAGGAIWALATIQKPQERGAYVPLTLEDIKTFARRLEESPSDTLPEPNLDSITDPTIREQANNEMRRVQKIFNRDKLLAATRLLEKLQVEFKVGSNADKEMMFARHNYYALAASAAILARGKP